MASLLVGIFLIFAESKSLPVRPNFSYPNYLSIQLAIPIILQLKFQPNLHDTKEEVAFQKRTGLL